MSLAAVLLLIVGCATSGANGLRIVNRDGNIVTGTAGAGWTDDELKNNPFGAICGGSGEVVSEIKISRSANGSARFAATCT